MDKISIQEATRSYSEGKVVVFKDLSLDVQENKVLCIVGPSGCGKTTLLRCIDGLIPLSAGRIERWDDWCYEWRATGDLHAELATRAQEKANAVSAGQAWIAAALAYHFGKLL